MRWLDKYTLSSVGYYPVYWSSDVGTTIICGAHWMIDWEDGYSAGACNLDSYGLYLWPDNSSKYYSIAHVRPIRVEE